MYQKIVLTGIIKIMKFLLVFIFLLTNVFAQDSAITKLINAYNNINDASGSFIQTSYIKDLDKTHKFKGKFFIKADRIKWQYEGESSQVIYLNRETLTVYDKIKKQAIQSSFSEDKFGQLPIALLSRMADIEKSFEITKKSENTLIFTPRTKMGNIKIIELIIHEDAFPIKSLKITDNASNTVKIDFYSVKVNTNLKDSIFEFIPRKDDTVIKY